MKRILIIAGSDSSGGAGVQRDCIVAHEYGLVAQTVVTAVTAQSHNGVRASYKVPPDVVAAQLQTAFENRAPDVVKIGMLGWKSTVNQVARILERHKVPVVLDPVLRTSSGGRLLTDKGIKALQRRLLPLARLVTPNLEEAAVLTGIPCGNCAKTLALQADSILGMGAAAVLIKGGHGTGAECCDHLFEGEQRHRYAGRRFALRCRGTGCTLATAIACELALGHRRADACQRGHKYTRAWIQKTGRAAP